MEELSCYDGYNVLCGSCQASPINRKIKISILRAKSTPQHRITETNQGFSILTIQTNNSLSHCTKGSEIQNEIHPRQHKDHKKL